MHFAEMKDPVKEKMKRFGLMSRFGDQAFFATIEEAVAAFLANPDLTAERHSRADQRRRQK
jgi:hypothetical protein